LLIVSVRDGNDFRYPTLQKLIADNLVSKANRIAEDVMARLSLAPQFAMAA